MRSKIGVLGLVILLSINLVFASQLDITVKSEAGDSLDIRIQNNNDGKTFSDGEFLKQIADSKGEVSISYSTIYEVAKISIIAKEAGSGDTKQFNGNSFIFFKDVQTAKPNSGKKVYIDLNKATPSVEYIEPEPEPEEVVEEVVEEIIMEESDEAPVEEVTEEPIEEKNTSQSLFSAFAIFKGNSDETTKSNSKLFIYGFIILLVIFIFPVTILIIRNKLKAHKTPKNIKITKLSSTQHDPAHLTQSSSQTQPQNPYTRPSNQVSNNPQAVDNEEKLIKDAEERIKIAQREINQIKNKKRIDEAEKKLRADQEELRKLKEGSGEKGGEEFENRLQGSH